MLIVEVRTVLKDEMAWLQVEYSPYLCRYAI